MDKHIEAVNEASKRLEEARANGATFEERLALLKAATEAASKLVPSQTNKEQAPKYRALSFAKPK